MACQSVSHVVCAAPVRGPQTLSVCSLLIMVSLRTNHTALFTMRACRSSEARRAARQSINRKPAGDGESQTIRNSCKCVSVRLFCRIRGCPPQAARMCVFEHCAEQRLHRYTDA